MAFPITIEDYYLVEVFIGYKIDNDFFFSHSSSDIGFVPCHSHLFLDPIRMSRFVLDSNEGPFFYLFIILHDVDLHLPGF